MVLIWDCFIYIGDSYQNGLKTLDFMD